MLHDSEYYHTDSHRLKITQNVQVASMVPAHRHSWRTGKEYSHLREAKGPGDVVSVDQLVSSVPGFIAQERTNVRYKLTKRRFKAATVFVLLDEVEPIGFAVALPPEAVEPGGFAAGGFGEPASGSLLTIMVDYSLVVLVHLNSASVWALSLGSGSGTVTYELFRECLPSGR